VRLRLEAMSLIERCDVLQDTDTTASWSLRGDIGSRVGVYEVVVQVLEVIVHRLVQSFRKSGTSWWWPIAKFVHVEGMQEAAEPIEMAPGAVRQSEVSRREVFL